jgi:hypothetical protein
MPPNSASVCTGDGCCSLGYKRAHNARMVQARTAELRRRKTPRCQARQSASGNGAAPAPGACAAGHNKLARLTFQAHRDTATIAIMVMMAAISASWMMSILRCCGLSGIHVRANCPGASDNAFSRASLTRPKSSYSSVGRARATLRISMAFSASASATT